MKDIDDLVLDLRTSLKEVQDKEAKQEAHNIET